MPTAHAAILTVQVQGVVNVADGQSIRIAGPSEHQLAPDPGESFRRPLHHVILYWYQLTSIPLDQRS